MLALAVATVGAVGCDDDGGAANTGPGSTTAGAGASSSGGTGSGATGGGAGGGGAGAPSPFVHIEDGRFVVGGETLVINGVNYWPPYAQPYWGDEYLDWITLWDHPDHPEIDAAARWEQDFAQMAANGITEVRIPGEPIHHDEDPTTFPSPERSVCKRFHQVFDIARKNGLYLTLVAPTPRFEDPYGVSHRQARADEYIGYLVSLIDACDFDTRPELLAYTVDIEGSFERTSDGRVLRRGLPEAIEMWNDFIVDHYGSVAAAEARWGEKLVRECESPRTFVIGGETKPMNGCVDSAAEEASSPCTKFSARACPPRHASLAGAYEAPNQEAPPAGETAQPRAAKDYLRFLARVSNRRFQRLSSRLKEVDPNHLVTSDSILKDQYESAAYYTVQRETTKYLDFGSVHVYHFQYPAFAQGAFTEPDVYASISGVALMQTAAAIAYLAPQRRPIVVGEFGISVRCDENGQPSGCTAATPASKLLALQEGLVSFDAPIFASGGAIGHRFWWWKGRRPMGTLSSKGREGDRTDYGILDTEDAARPVLAKLAASPAAYDAIQGSTAVFGIDTTYSASTPKRLLAPFAGGENARSQAAQAVLEGRPFGISTQCSGTDSTDTPRTCVDGSGYTCSASDEGACCPVACLDALFETVEIRDASGAWVDVVRAASSEVTVAKGAPLEARVRVGNVGEAAWESSTSSQGEVHVAVTGAGVGFRADLAADVASYASTEPIALTPVPAVDAATTLTFQMVAEGRAWFGERFRVTVVPR